MQKLRHNLAGVLLIALVAISCGGRMDNANNAESGITGSGQTSTPPTVTSITPANGAGSIYRDATIQITFGVVVNAATVTMTTTTACTGSIQLSTDVNFGTCLPMNQTVTQSGTQITVRTASQMPGAQLHYVRVTTAVAGSTGLTMVTQFESSFTTAANSTPLANEFGPDCSAGGGLISAFKTTATTTEGFVGPHSISGLIVTGIDRFGSFYLQKGAEAIYVDVNTTAGACGGSNCEGNKASHYGLAIGDEICLTITRGVESSSNVDTVKDFSAIKKTGINSITPLVLTDAYTTATISRAIKITGYLTTKSSSNVGGGFNHILTYDDGSKTMTLREWGTSGKMTSINQGDYVEVTSIASWFSSAPQITFDSGVGTISTGLTAPSYTVTGTVTGWASGENFTITLNGSNATVISANGAFTFTGNPTITGQYTVAISSNPATYLCNISNGTGYGLANVTNVTIACTPPPIYSMTSFASGDALTSANITFRCTPTSGDGNALLVNTPSGSYTGATNVGSTSFGVLGVGSNGISFSNVATASSACNGGGTSGYISSMDIPVNTTGKSNITLQFRAGQYQNQTRDWALRLQYSLDGTTFTDFDATGALDFDSVKAGSVSYNNASGMFECGPYVLPAGANNNPNLVIRWRYYQTVSTGGSVTRLVLDEIFVRDGGTTDSTAPTIGTLSLNGTGTDAALTWTSGSDNANAAANLVYRVYRHTSSFTAPGTGTLVVTSLPGQTAYTNTGLTQGVQVFYRLIAVDTQGNLSGQSNEVSYTPVDTTAPTVSSASPTSGATGIAFATSVSVTFSEAMTVAATQGAYSVKETNCTGTTVSTGSPAASGGNTIFTYSLTNLKPSTVYAHCVTTAATDAAAAPNALAADYSATWTTTALTEPTGVAATAGNTQVSIAFTVGNGNGGVKIVGQTGSTPADCSGAALYTGSTSPYVHTGLTNGTQYYYRVCSYHNTGAYLSTGLTAMATPTDAFNVNSAASTGNTTATVTFSAAPVTSEAQTSGNYKIVAGAGVCADAAVLTVSGAVLAGSVVTLTTAAQTASTSYKVCVTGVTRNSDAAALTTNNANFTGTGAGTEVSLVLYTFTQPSGTDIGPLTGGNTSGSPIITMTSTAGLSTGLIVYGAGVGAFQSISSINPNVSITLSANATSTNASTSFNFATLAFASKHANISSATNLTLNADKNGNTANFVGGCAPSTGRALTDNTWNLASASAALADHYFQFGVTIEPGYTLDVSKLNFDYQLSTGTGNWALYSDVDGYTTAVVTGVLATGTCQAATSTITSLNGRTGTVNFRLTAWGLAAAGTTLRIDNVDLRGIYQ